MTLTATWGSSSASIGLMRHPAPTLLSPGDGASVAVGSVRFDWTEELTSDQIQISTSSTFASTLVDSTMYATSELTTSLPVGSYFWRARAYSSTFTAGPWPATRSVAVR